MQAISSALNRLLERGSWFARAKEIRLLVVRVGAELRKPALQLLAGLEFHFDNRSAWLVLEDAHGPLDSGWPVRANRLLANWEARRDAFRTNEGLEMPPAGEVAAPDADRPAPPTAPFLAAASAVARALRPPLEGCVLVLAPAAVADPDAFGLEIGQILRAPPLSGYRVVWLIDEATPWPSLATELGEHALRCDCVPDPSERQKDLQALLETPNASFGHAMPRGVSPPPRRDDPPALPPTVLDANLRAAGIDPAYLEKAPELRRLLLSAAIAMKDGNGSDAVRQQREACDLAVAVNRHDVAVTCRVALASYLSGLQQPTLAIAELRTAIDVASRHGLGLQEAQARLALALLLSLGQDHLRAAQEYAACARCAEAAGSPLIAIEAWRLAGQLSVRAGAERQAFACLSEAIRLAQGATPETVQASSAAEAARKLASLCRDRGMHAQAQSLFDEADRMESGAVGSPAAPARATEAPPSPAATGDGAPVSVAGAMADVSGPRT